MKTKYIFVTGGVLSGLGKGVTAASIGNLLRSRGLKVWMQKFDQYLNVDAGTLNPNEHGEVFVLDDGAETDLDLGHYERFIDTNLNRTSSIMSGQIYQAILEKERSGKFLGKTIQVIPHVTDEVKRRIFEAAEKSGCDILITEIGGTIGDYEGTHFVEAIRQMQHDVGKENVLYLHVGFLPYLGASEELKTKPLQNSVHDLQAMGIQPDILIARADYPVNQKLLEKIALFCGVDQDKVIPLETVASIYKVPMILEKFKLAETILKKFKFKAKTKDKLLCGNLPAGKAGPQSIPKGQVCIQIGFQPLDYNRVWIEFLRKMEKPKKKTIKIGLIGKYMGMKDTYFSVTEALKIAAVYNNVNLAIGWIDAENISNLKSQISNLSFFNGLIVPGGFGSRGVEGKIQSIKYAREKKIPFLGLCYGLQLAVVEFSRNVAGLKDANTTENDNKTPHPVIHIMPEQEKLLEGENYGGTMRLGAYPCKLIKGTVAEKAYNKFEEMRNEKLEKSSSHRSHILSLISERHRHRYEFNNAYRQQLEKAGLTIAGTSPEGTLVEIIELPSTPLGTGHPFFVATQFHPEFKSRPLSPHPLFMEFIRASIKNTVSILNDYLINSK